MIKNVSFKGQDSIKGYTLKIWIYKNKRQNKKFSDLQEAINNDDFRIEITFVTSNLDYTANLYVVGNWTENWFSFNLKLIVLLACCEGLNCSKRGPFPAFNNNNQLVLAIKLTARTIHLRLSNMNLLTF